MSKSLNRVIVEEYLKDLRGGNFKQCQVSLHKKDEHCAIGVFDLTHKRITGKVLYGQDVYDKFFDIVRINQDKIWDKNDGWYDGKIWSFSEIADYIEENSPVMEKVG